MREKENYKYLEADDMEETKTKEKRLEKIILEEGENFLKNKLYRRNLNKGINTSTVPLVRYSEQFLK